MVNLYVSKLIIRDRDDDDNEIGKVTRPAGRGAKWSAEGPGFGRMESETKGELLYALEELLKQRRAKAGQLGRIAQKYKQTYSTIANRRRR